MTTYIPIDALNEPLLLRHQESQDPLLDLGEEGDGLLEVGRVLLELLLEQIPEGLVNDLLHLRLEGGWLLFRLQILLQIYVTLLSYLEIDSLGFSENWDFFPALPGLGNASKKTICCKFMDRCCPILIKKVSFSGQGQ